MATPTKSNTKSTLLDKNDEVKHTNIELNTESTLLDKNDDVKHTNIESDNCKEISEQEKEVSSKTIGDVNLEKKCETIEAPANKEESSNDNNKEEESNEKLIAGPDSNKDKESNEILPEDPSKIAFNPDLSDEEENKDILQRLRGDKIGTTMYSERFLISILLKLRSIKEPLEKNAKLEKELEILWDMTTEQDVVLKLLQFDVFEVFTHCIVNYSDDVRLIEILVGIVANMCCVVDRAMQQLSNTEIAMQMILQLINNSDSCILIQLMRLLAIVYTKKEAPVVVWNQQIKSIENFVDNFSFILNSSNNCLLLSQALETLNAILAKCAFMKDSKTELNSNGNEQNGEEENEETGEKFLEFFVNKSLINSSIEAFRTLHTKETLNAQNEEEEFDGFETISDSFRKAIIVILNIHDIFLNYIPAPYDDNCEHGLEICLNIIFNTIVTPYFVQYSNIDFMQNILECIGEIYLGRPNFHSEDHTFYVIKIWELLNKEAAGPTNATSNGNDFGNGNYENNLAEDSHELCYLTEELLRMLLQRCEVDTYVNIFRRCNPEIISNIFELYGVEIDQYDENNLNTYCAELETALHGIKDET